MRTVKRTTKSRALGNAKSKKWLEEDPENKDKELGSEIRKAKYSRNEQWYEKKNTNGKIKIIKVTIKCEN